MGKTSEEFWRPSNVPPPAGVVVQVKTPGGDERPLFYRDGLWWLPDGSMYVYFTPTHWCEAQP